MLYADYLVLCTELEEDLRMMIENFVKEEKRRGLRMNADQRIVMVLGEEEGSVSEVSFDGRELERVSETSLVCHLLSEIPIYKEAIPPHSPLCS